MKVNVIKQSKNSRLNEESFSLVLLDKDFGMRIAEKIVADWSVTHGG